jgi:hypothetical protein
VLIGVAVLILNVWFAKEPTPQALADEIERLLTDHYGGRDVDTFEHQAPNLHRTVPKILEEWVRLNEEQKGQVRDIINRLKKGKSSI